MGWCCVTVWPVVHVHDHVVRAEQELMVSGQWSIEDSFDDFRLVLGDNMM